MSYLEAASTEIGLSYSFPSALGSSTSISRTSRALYLSPHVDPFVAAIRGIAELPELFPNQAECWPGALLLLSRPSALLPVLFLAAQPSELVPGCSSIAAEWM